MTPIEKAREKTEALHALGLQSITTFEELRDTWRRIVFEAHPDRNNGNEADLAEVNAAYDFLCQEYADSFQKARARDAMPGRPATRDREVDLSPDLEALCRAKLGEQVPGEPLDGASARTQTGAASVDHVPSAMRRRGRQLSYIIPTPLEKGPNRVALPAGELVNRRKVEPKVFRFVSPRDGSGTVEVPDEARASIFPGAKSVRIHFAGA